MKLSELMADYYHLISKLGNQQEARQSLVGLVNIAIYDIQEKGQELTPEELEKHISDQIKEFLEAAKSQVA